MVVSHRSKYVKSSKQKRTTPFSTTELFSCCLSGPDGQLYFGKRRFAAWLSYGLLSATVLVVFPLRIIGYVPIESNGRLSTDLATYGHSVFFLVVIVSFF